MKKFCWSLNKSYEFLMNKKNDIEIPRYFMSQLSLFESRLAKNGNGIRSNTWTDLGVGSINDIDSDELLIRNTYLNGLMNNTNNNTTMSTKVSSNDISRLRFNSGTPGKGVHWSDNNMNRKDLLCIQVFKKDLLFMY